jgi:hypothetical protein
VAQIQFHGPRHKELFISFFLDVTQPLFYAFIMTGYLSTLKSEAFPYGRIVNALALRAIGPGLIPRIDQKIEYRTRCQFLETLTGLHKRFASSVIRSMGA